MRFLKKISLINIFRTPKKSDFFKMPFKNGDSLYWTRFAQNDPKPPGYAAWTLGGWNGLVFKDIQKRLGYYNRGPKTVTLFFDDVIGAPGPSPEDLWPNAPRDILKTCLHYHIPGVFGIH